MTWDQLDRSIVRCRKCPRLRAHCSDVAKKKRRAYQNEKYWGKPVPNFGDPNAGLLIVGLAPGAHGANRTGRMFTGDRSGDWLYRALHRAGLSNQETSTDAEDGLALINCAVTNACHCAPPDNRPTTAELDNCAKFLDRTVATAQPSVFLALGNIAWRSCIQLFRRLDWYQGPIPKFGHGTELVTEDGTLVGCYHPSQQNTFTGRLTEAMLDEVIQRAAQLAAE